VSVSDGNKKGLKWDSGLQPLWSPSSCTMVLHVYCIVLHCVLNGHCSCDPWNYAQCRQPILCKFLKMLFQCWIYLLLKRHAGERAILLVWRPAPHGAAHGSHDPSSPGNQPYAQAPGSRYSVGHNWPQVACWLHAHSHYCRIQNLYCLWIR